MNLHAFLTWTLDGGARSGSQTAYMPGKKFLNATMCRQEVGLD
jgi:hypothetical protein